MEKSGSQAKREDLYAGGLCRDCEAPLLDEELEADARRCGVCRAVAALRNAKKRDRTRSPQALDALYRPRIEAEQAKRTQAGLRPDTGLRCTVPRLGWVRPLADRRTCFGR